ncbi:TIR domain-containing protein [Bifidobacterium pseudolongum]|uniref:TIR domain-containing protein n=1 Tax=Bifidobacterium pseudolongum TaxID=1694 RepID=UPI001F5903AB|nr:TIR domain-containing protein [Bifidobacterium pseudolongum]
MSGNDNKYEIFVSYAHRDKDKRMEYFILQLRQIAKAYGAPMSAFIDERGLYGDWETILFSHLKSSNIFMPFISPAYTESEECVKELSTFVALARHSRKAKLIAPVFWKEVDESQLPNNGYSMDAYRYLKRIQGITVDKVIDDDVADRVIKDISSVDSESISLFKPFFLLRNGLGQVSKFLEEGKRIPESVIPEINDSLKIYISGLMGGTTSRGDDSQASEPVNTNLNATQAENAVVPDKPAASPTPSNTAPQVTKTPVKGSQNHKGYAPAHELMVKIYNTVAETPFVEGSKDRSSALKPEFRVPGVLETVSLTKDGAHLTQGMNFNLDSNIASVYISANWQGVPNDGSGRAYERGNDELGGFWILPRTHKLESYEPWEHDFDNTLANYLYRIKMSQPYAENYIAHRDEWQARYERFAAMPDVSSTYAKELFNGNGFVSANSRLEFVRDGRLLPVEQIDNEVLNRTIIAITDPAQVDEVIACINNMHRNGIRYYRVGALLDTKSDATNFVNALKKYRAFLEQQ